MGTVPRLRVMRARSQCLTGRISVGIVACLVALGCVNSNDIPAGEYFSPDRGEWIVVENDRLHFHLSPRSSYPREPFEESYAYSIDRRDGRIYPAIGASADPIGYWDWCWDGQNIVRSHSGPSVVFSRSAPGQSGDGDSPAIQVECPE